MAPPLTDGVRDLPLLRRAVAELQAGAGHKLLSVILYGSAARGDFQPRASDLNLLIVLADLEPETLVRLGPFVRRWLARGQPMPRIFSPELIRDAADVFPLEFLDLKRFRSVLHGSDPFVGVEVSPANLRVQCERELREKMMRLREGYVEAAGRPRALRRLLVGAHGSFVALFRGCLHLLGGEVPAHNPEVIAAFCERAGIEVEPFRLVEALRRGEAVAEDPRRLFSRYYAELQRAVHAVDRFASGEGGNER